MAEQYHFSEERSGVPPLVKAAIGLGLAAVVYAMAWIAMANVARDAALEWVEARRGEGFSVRYDDISESGFPLRITLDLDNPGFGAANGPAPWGWEGERLSLSIRPWNWNTVEARTWGAQMLAFSGDDGLATFTGSAAMMAAQVTFSDTQAHRLDATIDGLILKGDGDEIGNLAVGELSLVLTHGDAAAADYKTETGNIDIAASGLVLPTALATPLGDRVRALQLQARLMGDLGRKASREALETWRDSGGTFEIKRLMIDHGPAMLKADGTLALDGALQPIGAFTARLEGFFDVVDALQELGMVKPRDAVAAKMILGVMARQPEDGGPPVLNLALTVQDRKLYAGPVALLELAPVNWD